MKRNLVAVLLAAVFGASPLLAAPGESRLIDVGGYRLNFNVAPGKRGTILFESGGGDDSSVWEKVATGLREKTPATIITYDRAGFGKSEPAPGAYRIDDEVAALVRSLEQLGVQKDLVIVAHSYGGFIATLYAAEHLQQVRGVILIDANLASFFTPTVVNQLMSATEAQRAEMRKTQPAQARVLDAFPETVRRMQSVQFPVSIPCLVIAAERPPTPDAESASQWKRAHEEFAREVSNRRLITAPGTSHFVMRDAPDFVVKAVADFLKKILPTP